MGSTIRGMLDSSAAVLATTSTTGDVVLEGTVELTQDAEINTSGGEWDVCVSPDGDFIVFASTRDDGFGRRTEHWMEEMGRLLAEEEALLVL